MLHVPRPTPSPPRRVTPTLVAAFERCPLRAGFEGDPRFSYLRRTGLRAALGIAAHAVVARARSGSTFEAVWAEETARARGVLVREWAPATPPSVTSWPGAALTRARLAKGWRRGAGAALAGPSPTGAGPKAMAPGAEPLPWRERWLEHSASGLAGRADLVERDGDHVRVVDLKSGVWQDAMTAEQRQQLLLYCALVWKVLGEMPARAAVLRADGVVDEFEVVDVDVREAERRALQVLATLTAASRGEPLEAAPGEGVCGSCPFRAVCGPFLDVYDPSWRCGAVRVGRVRALSPAESAEVDVEAPGWAAGRMRLVGFPIPAAVEKGAVIGVSDYEGYSGTGLARWNTLVAPWPAA